MKKLLTVLFLFGLILNNYTQDTNYIYQDGGVIVIDGVEASNVYVNPTHISYKKIRSDYVIKDNLTKNVFNIGEYTEVFRIDTTGFDSEAEFLTYLNKIINRSVNDVALQDQTSQAVIINFNKIAQSTTLAADRAVGDTFITVLDTLGASSNTYVIAFNQELKRFSSFNTLSINIDTLFLDSPLDVPYDSGSFIDLTSKNLAVDGSGTTQVFGLRGVSPSPVGITVDITRIIITCITDSPVDLSTFADISGGITNGLLLRVRDGEYFNVFNVKTNQEIAGLAYDWTPYAATNPVQGQDGFTCRLTFAGQNKIGVTLRLKPGEDLEFLVKDDLSSITKFEIIAEGHIVED